MMTAHPSSALGLKPQLTVGPTIRTATAAAKTDSFHYFTITLYHYSCWIACGAGSIWWVDCPESDLSLGPEEEGRGRLLPLRHGRAGGNQCWRHPLPPSPPPAFYHPSTPLCLPTLARVTFFFTHSSHSLTQIPSLLFTFLFQGVF